MTPLHSAERSVSSIHDFLNGHKHKHIAVDKKSESTQLLK